MSLKEEFEKAFDKKYKNHDKWNLPFDSMILTWKDSTLWGAKWMAEKLCIWLELQEIECFSKEETKHLGYTAHKTRAKIIQLSKELDK